MVDFSTASADQMATVPNIGPVRSRAIVQLREECGLSMSGLVHVTNISEEKWLQYHNDGLILLPFLIPDQTNTGIKAEKETIDVEQLLARMNTQYTQMNAQCAQMKKQLEEERQEKLRVERESSEELNHLRQQLNSQRQEQDKNAKWRKYRGTNQTRSSSAYDFPPVQEQDETSKWRKYQGTNQTRPSSAYDFPPPPAPSRGNTYYPPDCNQHYDRSGYHDEYSDTRSRQSFADAREHRQGPSAPPMQSFGGEKGKWKSFRFQFEHMATSFKWTEMEKLDRLLWCMRDKAIDFIMLRPMEVRSSYRLLIVELEKRFGQFELPSAKRRELAYVKQEEQEGLDDFADRVLEMAVEGHPGMENAYVQQMAIDAFLRGCSNKLAALMCLDKDCTSLFEAVHHVKENIQGQRSIGKPNFSLRQVNFKDEVRSQSPTPCKLGEMTVADLNTLVKEIVQNTVSTLNLDKKPSAVICFKCNREGHVARDCHENSPSYPRQRTWSPQRQSPSRTNTCFKCSRPGHFSRDCPNGSPSNKQSNPEN